MLFRIGMLGLLLLMGASSKPTLHFAPAPVPYAQRSESQSFDIHLRFSPMPTTPATVELTLDNGHGEPRTFTAQATGVGDLWRVSAPLVPAYLHPLRLRVAARYSSGSVKCEVEDTDLEIGSETVALSTVRDGVGGAAPRLVLSNGKTLGAMPSVLTNLRGDLGPVAVTLNLAQADSFTVEVIHPSLASVSYCVKVTIEDRVVAEQLGDIAIVGVPPPKTVAPLTQPTDARLQETKKN